MGFRYRLLLLWLVGASLRVTVLAVPPLLPTIHHDLGLSETLVGALTSLPILLLAAASIPGSLLISRLGARRALVLGLVVMALAGAARGVGAMAAVLFAMTFLMGVGIAVSQPAMPSLVRQWAPQRVGLATAVYANGFLIGEVIAVVLTVPVALPLSGGRWEVALALWSVPILVVAVAVFFSSAGADTVEAGRLWWPDWRDTRTWRLGLIFGCGSISYFTANAFIPDYLKATGHGGYIFAALTTLNLGQIPASFVVGTFEKRFVARRWPLVLSGGLSLLSIAGFAVGGVWVVIFATTLGFAAGLVLVLVLALPPLLASAAEVHRLSAAIFTLTYTCSFLSSLVGGAIWDATGVPYIAFTPILAGGTILLGLVWGLDLDAAREERRTVL